jgi:hypothetical protein
VPIEIVFKRVGTRVSATTRGRQEPWIALSLRGDFYFVTGSNTGTGQASSGSTSPPVTSTQPTSVIGPTEGGSTSSQEAKAIATKDIGSFRVVLKSVMPMKRTDQNDQSVNGIRFFFEFINRETQRHIVVAMNATNKREVYSSTWLSNTDCGLGVGLRSSLVDSNGDSWSYSSVTGINIIGVGCAIKVHDPSEIVSMLEKQDRLNGASLPRNAQYVYGSPSTINPGQTMSIVMTFVLSANEQKQVSKPQFFQIESEIVVGLVMEGTRMSYSLHNVIFDRVSVPRGSM